MNRSAFCTFYKLDTEKKFITFSNEYCVDCSFVMLRETDLPIADICFAAGFEDIPHYNRRFKKLAEKSSETNRSEERTVAPLPAVLNCPVLKEADTQIKQ